MEIIQKLDKMCLNENFHIYSNLNWRPPWKSGLTPKSTKPKVVRYAIIQMSQWFSGLTHSSLKAFN